MFRYGWAPRVCDLWFAGVHARNGGLQPPEPPSPESLHHWCSIIVVVIVTFTEVNLLISCQVPLLLQATVYSAVQGVQSSTVMSSAMGQKATSSTAHS